MLHVLTRQRYSAHPRDTLYHYTTLTELLGSVASAELSASEIRYLNGPTKSRHTH